jgi:hypothetical protein
MFGIVLFSLILLAFGFLLSTELILKIVPQWKEMLAKVDEFSSAGATKVILSMSAIIIGIWNFFAPNFGASFSPTIIGAFIPSIIMIFDGAVIYPNIIEILNIPQDQKDKYYVFVEKYRSIAGVITIVAGLLHFIQLGSAKTFLF